MYPHFEGVELQHECRQRQPQIIQFPGPGIVAVFHDEFRLRFGAPLPADRKPRHTDARLTDGDQYRRCDRQYEGMFRPVEGKSAALPVRRTTNVSGGGADRSYFGAIADPRTDLRFQRREQQHVFPARPFPEASLLNCQYFR
jgi:hypothetical protein